eukprot:CAMPEP_0184490282 /NCGR_PEP_ID=MMETSP0113_2-20130426/17458_1 /TAXON_ID=91329 /ORGANISM="Norrisiella sphaerica, Strain BC52" /LENGTH=248 /DNA_ID=CAMNT_0026874079 /DNA_START=514 /DNA_END=1260 /DNA_ORIENTATION=-
MYLANLGACRLLATITIVFYIQKHGMYSFIFANVVLFDVMNQLTKAREFARIWISYVSFIKTLLLVVGVLIIETLEVSSDTCLLAADGWTKTVFYIALCTSALVDLGSMAISFALIFPMFFFEEDKRLVGMLGKEARIKNAIVMLMWIVSTIVFVGMFMFLCLKNEKTGIPAKEVMVLYLLDTCINVVFLNLSFPIRYLRNALACSEKPMKTDTESKSHKSKDSEDVKVPTRNPDAYARALMSSNAIP